MEIIKKESNGPTKHEKYQSQEEKTSLDGNKCILDTAEEKNNEVETITIETEMVNIKGFFLILKISLKVIVCGEGHDNPLQYSCLENPMD